MMQKHLPLHEPVLGGNEWRYVKECLDTAWVSSAGAYVSRFEEMFAEWIGVRYAVAVVNGTAALHLALRGIDVKAGDEVLVPSLTFIATANSVSYVGAFPRFVDAEESTLGMNPDVVASFLERETEVRADGRCYHRESGRRIAACLPVHVLGHPVRMDRLGEICSRYGLPVIEDATESLGSSYQGRAMGSFGIAGCFSFNGNKIITTGGGGMVVTDDKNLATRIRHLSTQAKCDPFAYWHDEVGYNYRLPNVNAALGCAQMEQLKGFLEKKREIAQWYHEALALVPSLRLISEPPDAQSNFWLNAIQVDSASRATALCNLLKQNGIESRPFWAPCHKQPMFDPLMTGEMVVTEKIWKTCLMLPSSASLTMDDVTHVCKILGREL